MTTATDSAVTVIEASSPVEVNLDNWPAEKFNRLIPVQTIRMPSDFFVPVVQAVTLDPADRDGKSPDHYKSSDVPAGHRAPTTRALDKFASAAGVSFHDERRTDDGSDPDVMGVTVTASMLTPTGQRISRQGSQLINIRTWFGSQTSDAEKAKFRKQFYAHVATRAKNRAIRGLLSLRASYPDADIRKPFAVVSYAPNMNHPAVQQAFLAAMAPAIDSAFGSDRGNPASQLAPGQPTELLVSGEAPEAPSPAEVAAQPPAVPDWAQPAPPAEPKPLAQLMGDSASVSDEVGPATDEQKGELQALIGGLDWSEEIIPVLVASFGDAAARSLTKGQASAILKAASSFQSTDEFVAAWKQAAAA